MRRFLGILFFLANLSVTPIDAMQFLYQNKVGSLIRPVFTGAWFSHLVGFGADRWISKIFICPFITKNNIDMNEALRKNPCQYASFNDFFTRKLEQSARPICSEPKSICSPADGTLYVVENIQENTEFVVKGSAFNLPQFLNDRPLAESFYGGTLMLIYLSPADYHRFHAPFGGSIKLPLRIKGKYESVNPLIFNRILPLAENERQLLILRDHDAHQVAFVAVGALCVGRISFTYVPALEVQKGQELGYFSFGGSTIVLIFPPNTVNINTANEQKIKMGQCIGHFKI